MSNSLNLDPACLQRLGLNEIYVWFLLPTYPNFYPYPKH